MVIDEIELLHVIESHVFIIKDKINNHTVINCKLRVMFSLSKIK